MLENETLNDAFDPRKNSFTFLRLSLAVLVVYSHTGLGGFGFGQDVLTGFSHGQSSFGSIGVQGFFVISGFLVTNSYLKKSSIWRYLWHRTLKVFPGYWVCLLVTALLFGAVIHYYQHGNLNYFHSFSDAPFSYIKANLWLMIRQRGIGNLLTANPYPNDFNGSLWVLKFFGLCYVGLAFLGVLGFLKKRKAITIGLLFCVWMAGIFDQYVINRELMLLPAYFIFKIPNVVVYFLAGSVFFLEKKRIPLHYSLFLGSVLLTFVSWRYRFYTVVSPVTFAYVLIWLAVKLPLDILDYWGDYSYGIYIYAFPIQQMLYVFGLHNHGKWVYFLVSLVFAMLMAFGSWWLIEKPCLGLKSISLEQLRARMAFRRTKCRKQANRMSI
jgi:peptidoglycan/LPS O-acetylase OafA/YrhL